MSEGDASGEDVLDRLRYVMQGDSNRAVLTTHCLALNQGTEEDDIPLGDKTVG